MAINYILEDVLDEAETLLTAEFPKGSGFTAYISHYGDGWSTQDLDLERRAEEKGTTVADLFYMPDGSPNWMSSPDAGFEIFDFSLTINDEEQVFSEGIAGIPDEIQKRAIEIIKPLGLITLETDSAEYAFGRYAPWYSAKSLTTKGWKYEYGIKDMQPEHPYWPDDLDQADSLHDCFDNAKVEIMENDMIILECEVCKKTAEFERSTDFNRRN